MHSYVHKSKKVFLLLLTSHHLSTLTDTLEGPTFLISECASGDHLATPWISPREESMCVHYKCLLLLCCGSKAAEKRPSWKACMLLCVWAPSLNPLGRPPSSSGRAMSAQASARTFHSSHSAASSTGAQHSVGSSARQTPQGLRRLTPPLRRRYALACCAQTQHMVNTLWGQCRMSMTRENSSGAQETFWKLHAWEAGSTQLCQDNFEVHLRLHSALCFTQRGPAGRRKREAPRSNGAQVEKAAGPHLESIATLLLGLRWRLVQAQGGVGGVGGPHQRARQPAHLVGGHRPPHGRPAVAQRQHIAHLQRLQLRPPALAWPCCLIGGAKVGLDCTQSAFATLHPWQGSGSCTGLAGDADSRCARTRGHPEVAHRERLLDVLSGVV